MRSLLYLAELSLILVVEQSTNNFHCFLIKRLKLIFVLPLMLLERELERLQIVPNLIIN